jgi:hypothetical protein
VNARRSKLRRAGRDLPPTLFGIMGPYPDGMELFREFHVD